MSGLLYFIIGIVVGIACHQKFIEVVPQTSKNTKKNKKDK